MHAQSNLNAERALLPKIHRTAVAILEECNAGTHISNPTPVLDTSSIAPLPHDIVAPLMKLPEGIRQELLGCFANRLNERERFLSFFRSACKMIRNANDSDAISIPKHQRKNRSGKKTFNNVSSYGRSHVYVPPTAILGIYAITRRVFRAQCISMCLRSIGSS